MPAAPLVVLVQEPGPDFVMEQLLDRLDAWETNENQSAAMLALAQVCNIFLLTDNNILTNRTVFSDIIM